MYNNKNKVAVYGQQMVENLNMMALFVKCLERTSQLVAMSFEALEKKEYSNAQRSLDKANDIIGNLCYSMAAGVEKKDPVGKMLFAYLQKMQVTLTRASLQKNIEDGKRLAASFLKVAKTLQKTNKKNQGPAAIEVTASKAEASIAAEMPVQNIQKPVAKIPTYGAAAKMGQRPINISA